MELSIEKKSSSFLACAYNSFHLSPNNSLSLSLFFFLFHELACTNKIETDKTSRAIESVSTCESLFLANIQCSHISNRFRSSVQIKIIYHEKASINCCRL